MAAPSTPGGHPPRMASGYFLAELARLLPGWVSDGLVTKEDAARLSSAYRLGEVQDSTVSAEPVDKNALAIRLAFVIGGLLFGFGVIAFVAANWAQLPDYGKALIVNASVAALYLSGYYCWFKKNMPALGHSLIFAGAIAFGADLGLMAQAYNESLPHFGGYGVWAFGVLLLAVLLRSVPLTILSLSAGCVWLFGGAFDLTAEPNLIRFYSAAALLGWAGWATNFRWLYVFSFASLVVGSSIFIGQATGDFGYTVAGLLALCGLVVSASLYARSLGSSPEDTSAPQALSWIAASLLVFMSAIALISSSIPPYSSKEFLREEWREAAWLLFGIIAVSAGFFTFAIARLRVRPRALALPIAIAACAASVMVLNLLAAAGFERSTLAVWVVALEFAFGGLWLAYGLGEGRNARFGLGYLNLVLASFVAVSFAGVAAESFALAVLILMLLGSAWDSSRRLIAARGATPVQTSSVAAMPWLIVGSTSFVASYHNLWQDDKPPKLAGSLGEALWGFVWGLAILTVLASLFSAFVARLDFKRIGIGGGVALCGLALAVAALGSMAGWAYGIPTALSIIASVGFGSCLVAEGLESEGRSLFWLGATFLVASVLLRFFEYETSQLAKSLAFLISGAVVLLAGAFFERRNRHREAIHAP